MHFNKNWQMAVFERNLTNNRWNRSGFLKQKWSFSTTRRAFSELLSVEKTSSFLCRVPILSVRLTEETRWGFHPIQWMDNHTGTSKQRNRESNLESSDLTLFLYKKSDKGEEEIEMTNYVQGRVLKENLKYDTDENPSEYIIESSPNNIAAFIMKYGDAESIIISDEQGNRLLQTSGSYIESYTEKELFSKVMNSLVPMQRKLAEIPEVELLDSQSLNECALGM